MKILISSCVLGNSVRWNGSHKHFPDIKRWASENGFELIAICPEHELFGTPRQPIRLHKIAEQTVAMMKNNNVYPELVSKCREILARYPDVVGYIGIANSPSCGLSVGVKGAGSTMKAPMHYYASFPTTEINSMKKEASRNEFKLRILKWVKNQEQRDSSS